MSENVPVDEFTKIESIFIRHRNILMLRGHFPGIYTDYYLHLMQHGLKNPENLDTMLKDLTALLTLHLVARPWNETIAWTVNLRAPRANLFVTGSSVHEQVTGRCFTEDIREPDRNLFYSQTTVPNKDRPMQSTLEVEDNDPVEWIQSLYTQSEQRPGRAFRLPDETFVLLAAQPDFDEEWFEGLDTDQVATIEQVEQTKLLETRQFRFHCGCNIERILPILGAWREKPEELFAEAEEIGIQCPRCAAKYRVTRDMI